MDVVNIQELKREKVGLVTRAREIQGVADGEKRDLSQEELNNFEKLAGDATALQERITREERLLGLEAASLGRGPSTMGSGAQSSDAEALAKGTPQDTREYRSAFRRWMVLGENALTDGERRALSSTDAQGGFMMTPTQVMNDLVVAINNMLFIRAMATKIQIEPNAKSIGVPTIAADPADPDWTAEVAAITEDTALAFGRRELTPFMLTKYIKVSNKLLRSVSSAESIVTDRLAYKFAVAMEKAYMAGAEATGPLGVFVLSSNGIGAGSDVTAAGAAAITFDDIVKLKYALPQQYWAKASWVVHPTVALTLALVKETVGGGQYVWRESTRVGEPATLLGQPVHMSAYAPATVATGLYTAILGDFSYYWVVDSLSFQMQRLSELYAINSQTGFIGTLETDGAPVLSDAFRRLKQA